MILEKDLDPEATERSKLILLTNGWDPADPDLALLVEIANDWWSDTTMIGHRCRCRGGVCTVDSIVHRLASALSKTLLSSRPEIPIPSRWWKCLRCLQWFRPLFEFHNIANDLFHKALAMPAAPQREEEQDEQQADEGAQGGEADPALHVDGGRQAYEKERRTRKQKTMEFVDNFTQRWKRPRSNLCSVPCICPWLTS